MFIQIQVKLATIESKLDEEEKKFKELSHKYQEMEAQWMRNVREKEGEIEQVKAQYHTQMVELKKAETRQQIAQKETEMQLARFEQERIGLASQLSRLQKERNREDEFSRAFEQEFQAKKVLMSKCEELENQLGTALDSLDVSDFCVFTSVSTKCHSLGPSTETRVATRDTGTT